MTVGKIIAFHNLIVYVILEICREFVIFQVVERHPRMTLDQLISNIGGQLGVWAGISILTLSQFVIYIISGLFTDPKKKKKKQKDKQRIKDKADSRIRF